MEDGGWEDGGWEAGAEVLKSCRNGDAKAWESLGVRAVGGMGALCQSPGLFTGGSHRGGFSTAPNTLRFVERRLGVLDFLFRGPRFCLLSLLLYLPGGLCPQST